MPLVWICSPAQRSNRICNLYIGLGGRQKNCDNSRYLNIESQNVEYKQSWKDEYLKFSSDVGASWVRLAEPLWFCRFISGSDIFFVAFCSFSALVYVLLID